MKEKVKVLFFARSFLCRYYSDIRSEVIEPIFVTLTRVEKKYLEEKGWPVYGCFEEEYDSIPETRNIPADYLHTSFASDRYLKRYPYEKRLEILGKEISFWGRILDDTKPEYLFNETVAIEIAEVMAIEAEKRSIPFYSALLGFLPNTFYWKPDPYTGSLKNIDSVVPKEKDYQLAQKYIEEIRVKKTKPFYINGARKGRISFLKMIKSTVGDCKRLYTNNKRIKQTKGFVYEDFSGSFFSSYKVYRLQKKYKYNSLEDIKGKECFFFPMHLEPEAVINYFVVENYSQSTLVDLIAKSMGVNQYLVVKEHPQHPGALLKPEYQNLKKLHKNVIFLPSYESSYKVLEQAKAVITLTSSAAWEGLILGKPAIVLGNIFYDQCPGALKVESIRDIRKIVRSSIPLPKDEDVLTFVAKMIAIFNKGCPTPYAVDSGIKDYVNAIERIIENDERN